jgi:hypothetical protein
MNKDQATDTDRLFQDRLSRVKAAIESQYGQELADTAIECHEQLLLIIIQVALRKELHPPDLVFSVVRIFAAMNKSLCESSAFLKGKN